jgi:hypothetical protein
MSGIPVLVFAFKLFHYVYIYDKIFGLDFNLFIIYHFYFVFASGDFSSCEKFEKLWTLATKMGGDLTVFSILTLMFVLSSSSSNPSKKFIVDTGLLG